MSQLSKIILTTVVVLVAVGAVAFKYKAYLTNPWTRDGQVRANVIQVAPRVSGPLVDLPIVDNQFVKAGDLLFEIDPRTFKANLDQARATFDKTKDDIAALEKQVDAATASVAQVEAAVTQAVSNVKAVVADLEDADASFERAKRVVKEGAMSQQRFDDLKAQYSVALANKEQADAQLLQAKSSVLQTKATLAQAEANLGAPGDENAQLRAAKAAVDQAELDLEFTRVKASVDGYVTNLSLRIGSQAVGNQPALALVDVNSYWLDAYFRETLVGRISPGDKALVTLMSYPNTPVEGQVNSIGWGIAQDDGSPGVDLLPNISPTFEWIRLAQRVPVRVQFDSLPDGVELRVGTTASVLVFTGSHEAAGTPQAPAAPKALQ